MDMTSCVSKTWGRLTASVLIYLLTVNPVLAAALTVDTSRGGNTSLDQAGNGVPIVNIATPNGQGLSHNRFTDYNVDPQGLILNNSNQQISQSQLGGLLQNNPNLTGAAANLILNEVTGTRPSTLKGYTEVFGQQAGVVVANPYGITCNGCGFINTPHATLTTGTPKINGGRLTGFNVDGGRVAIEGLGLNAANIDRFDIITRALDLNAELNARKLNIVTGRNHVDAATLAARAKSDNGSTVPDFALDASALGAMYANSIYLVGTENGVGVRTLANMAASGGDITLDVNGDLSLSALSASHDINLTTSGDLTANETLYAANNLSTQVTGQSTLKQTTAAGKSVDIRSGSISQQGTLAAGVNSDGTLNTQGRLTINTGQLTNTGTVRASQSLSLTTTELDNRTAAILSGGTLTIQADSLDNRGGQVDGKGDSRLTVTGAIDNRKASDHDSVISSQQGDLTLQAASLDNTGGWIQGTKGEISITTTGDVINLQGQILGRTARVTARDINNREGKIQGENLALSVSNFDNTKGLLKATEDKIHLTATDQVLNSEGRVDAKNTLILKSGDITNNKGQIVTSELQVTAGDFSNREGLVEISNHLDIRSSGLVDNTLGIVRSLGTEGLSQVTAAEKLLNKDGQIAINNADVNLSAQKIINTNGQIKHAGDGRTQLDITSFNNVSGQLLSNGSVSGTSIEINNRKGTLAGNRLSITGSSSLDNTQGTIEADQLTLTIDGQLTNDGGRITQFGTNDQNLSAKTVSNGQAGSQSGRIETNAANLTVTTDELTNSGELVHAGEGLLSIISGWINNAQGKVLGNGDITLETDQLTNTEGKISGDQLVITNAGKTENTKGQLLAKEELHLSGTTLDNSEGTIAGETINLASTGAITNRSGTMESQKTLEITGSQLNNSQGTVRALGEEGQTQLIITDEIDNTAGAIEANNQNLSIQASKLINSSGHITHAGDGTLKLAMATLDNSQGEITGNGILNLKNGNRLNQNGTLSARQINLTGSGDINNTQGTIEADQLTLIIDGQLTNDGGRITQFGTNDQNLSAKTVSNGKAGSQSGRIETNAANLTVTTDKLANSGELVHAGEGLLSVISGWINNAQGKVLGNGDISLKTDQLTNTEGKISGDQLVITNTGQTENTKGQLLAKEELQLSGTALDNSEGTIAGETVNLAGTEAITNRSGTVESQKTLKITGSQLDNNQGTVRALGEEGQTQLTITGKIDNSAGAIESNNQNLAINASELTNSHGHITHAGDGTLQLAMATLDNSQGEITGNGTLNHKNGNRLNQNGTLSARQISLTGSGDINNTQGTIEADQLTLTIDGQLTNDGGRITQFGTQDQNLSAKTVSNGKAGSQSGRIETNAANLTVTTDELTNSGELVHAGEGLLSVISGWINNAQGKVLGNGDISLETDTLTNTEGKISGDQLTITNTGKTENTKGQLLAKEELQLSGTTLDNSEGTIAGETVNLASTGAITNHSGTVESQKTLEITGSQLNNSQGTVRALGEEGQTQLTITGKIDNSAGAIEANNQSVSISASQLVNNSGHITHAGDGALQLAMATLDNSQGEITGNGVLNHQSGTRLNQNGTLSARQINLTGSGDINNTQGTIEADQLTLTIDGQLTNDGGRITQFGTSNQNISAKTISNSKVEEQSGRIETNAASLTINTDELNNSGELVHAGEGLLSVISGWINNAQGKVLGNGDITLETDQLTNTEGKISGDQLTITNTGKTENTKGQLLAKEKLQLSGTALDNSEGTIAGATVNLASTEAITNQSGTVESQKTLRITGSQLNNSQGTVRALGEEGQTQLTITGKIDNSAGAIEANNQNLSISASELSSGSGHITHAGDGTLQLAMATLDNSQGEITGNGVLNHQNGTRLNQNGTLSARQINLTGSGDINNTQGTIEADQLTLTIDGQLTNDGGRITQFGSSDQNLSAKTVSNGKAGSHSGRIETNAANLTVTTDELTNSGELVHAGEGLLSVISGWINNAQGKVLGNGDISLETDTLTNTEGKISGDQLTITNTGKTENTKGQLLAKEELQLSGTTLDNSEGTIAGETVNLASTGAITNHSGTVESQKTLEITGSQLNNSQGTVRALGEEGQTQLTITGKIDNSAGAIEANNQNLSISARELTNSSGHITHAGNGTLQLDMATLDNRQGEITGNGVLNHQNGARLNQNGTLSARQINLTGNGGINNTQGIIEADQLTLTIDGQLTNDGGRITQFGSSDQSLSAKTISNGEAGNQSGRIETNAANLTVTTDELTNSGELVHAGEGLLSVISGWINNAQGKTLGNGDISLETDQLTNTEGKISGDQLAITNTGKTENTKGQLLAKDELRLSGTALDNSEGTIAGETVNLASTGAITNHSGTVESQKTLKITGSQLNNSQGTVRALGEEGQTQLTITGKIDNSAGAIESNNQNLFINASELTNSHGHITHAGDGTLQLAMSTLDNSQGEITGNGVLKHQNGTRLNQNGTVSARQISLTGSGDINNTQGTIEADQLTLTIDGHLTNDGGRITQFGSSDQNLSAKTVSNGKAGSQSGRIETNAANLTVSTDELTNSGELVHAGEGLLSIISGWINNDQGKTLGNGDISLKTDQLTNTEGKISGDQLAITNTGKTENTKGQLLAKEELQISGTALDNSEGTIAGETVNLIGTEAITNQSGTVESQKTLEITGSQLNNSQGTVRALGEEGQTQLTITDEIDNTAGAIEANNQNLSIQASKLINSHGHITHAGDGTLQLAMATLDNSQGEITGNGVLNHQNGTRLNQNGTLSARQVSLTGSGDIDNTQGTIEADQLALTIDGQLTNDGGRITQFGTSDQHLSAKTVSNGKAGSQSGRIETNAANLTVTTDELTNSGELVHAGEGLLSVISGWINNAQGKVLGNGDISLETDTADQHRRQDQW